MNTSAELKAVPLSADRAAWQAQLRYEYDLSPAEVRFAEAFLELASTREVAHRIGITYGTARHRMHRICRKTGAASQTQLIKLLLVSRLTGALGEQAFDLLRVPSTH